MFKIKDWTLGTHKGWIYGAREVHELEHLRYSTPNGWEHEEHELVFNDTYTRDKWLDIWYPHRQAVSNYIPGLYKIGFTHSQIVNGVGAPNGSLFLSVLLNTVTVRRTWRRLRAV
jgi:hypothetical protein